VRPRSDPKPAEQVQRAERDSAQHSEHERLQLERIAVGADVVKRGKDERADDRGENPCSALAKTENDSRSSGEARHEKDAKEQLLVQAGAERQHESRRPARLREWAHRQSARAQCLQWSEQLGRRNTDDESENERERRRFAKHPNEHRRPKTIFARSQISNDKADPDQNDRRHEDRGTVNTSDHCECAAQQRVGAVAQLSLAGLRKKRGKRLVSKQQGQREENAVPMGPAHRKIRAATCDGGTSNGGIHDSTVRWVPRISSAGLVRPSDWGDETKECQRRLPSVAEQRACR